MNIERPHCKSSYLEQLINAKVIYLGFFQILATLTFVIYKSLSFGTEYELVILGDRSNNILIVFFRFLTILSSFIPISLFVSLELIRLMQSVFMQYNDELSSVRTTAGKGAGKTVERQKFRANNYTMADELGCIDYVLSDKTGTLTKNKLSLDALFVAGDVYGGKLERNSDGSISFDKYQVRFKD